jgi:GT2 family glycosyltransferase
VPSGNIDNESVKLSVLILNWNGEKYIADCLRSLRQQLSGSYEVVVVDNASTDGSAETVEKEFPWAKLIRSAENLGFAGGNNLAAQHAAGQYFLLLNYDTLLMTDVLDGINLMEQDEKIGIVGAAMYGKSGELRLSAGHFPTPSRLWLFSSMWSIPSEHYLSPTGIAAYPMDVVEGSFLLMKADLWHKLGGMDERNYMYGDDIELCKSVSLAGLQTVQCPSIKYVHFGGYEPARMGYLFAGYRRYHEKFSGTWTRLHADFVLRAGIFLRLFSYGVQCILKQDMYSRQQFKAAWELNWNWSQTGVEKFRFHR